MIDFLLDALFWITLTAFATWTVSGLALAMLQHIKRVRLNLTVTSGGVLVRRKHMIITVNGVLSQPLTFHINPKGPDAKGNPQEAPVTDIAWTLDTDTLLVVANSFGAVFTPTVAGVFNLTVSAKNSEGATLNDGATITIVDDTPPPVIVADSLNLAVG